MTREYVLTDICQTCNNVRTCETIRNVVHPVFDCDQYDDFAVKKTNVQSHDAAPAKKGPDAAMGLCCNCGNLHSCKIVKAPGGVWHCEEYV